MKTKETESAPDIVVVDDAPDNLQLLVDLLAGRGYRARAFAQGGAALRAISRRRPDLVLLDITMPVMDGYEVCRRLRSDPNTHDLPVIFLSALEDAEGKVLAFESGGVDYVTKPFQPEEVLARIALHLDLARERAALAESYRNLQGLEETRDALTHMVAHDIRSPLWSVDLTLNAVTAALAGREPAVRRTISRARASVQEALELLHTMLELSRLQQQRMPLHVTEFDFHSLAKSATKEIQPRAGRRKVTLAGELAAVVHADRDVVRRVVFNLLGNAVKFTTDDGRIVLKASADGDRLRVEVEDDGVGIDAETQTRLFSGVAPSVDASGSRGFGLGLAFVKIAVAAHGGTTGVRSRPGEGTVVWFTLPRGSAVQR